MRPPDGIPKKISVGTAVEITYGAFSGTEGEVVRVASPDDLSGLVLTPEESRDAAIPVRASIDGEHVVLGVSREYLVLR